MNRTVPAALCCALLVAMAGCPGTGQDPATTVTPAAVPELTGAPAPTPTSTPTPPDAGPVTVRRTALPNASVSDISFPPGTDGRGIVEPETLVAANRRAAADGGYVLLINETQETVDDAGGRTMQGRRLVVRVSDSGRIYSRSRRPTGSGTDATVSGYANATGLFLRRASGGNVSYERADAIDVGSVREEIPARELARYLDAGDWRPRGPTTADGGVPAVSFRFVSDSENVERSLGQLIATESGVVRLLTFRTVTRSGTRRVVRSVTYRFEPRGNLTVTPPAWVQRAATSGSTTTTAVDDPSETVTPDGDPRSTVTTGGNRTRARETED